MTHVGSSLVPRLLGGEEKKSLESQRGRKQEKGEGAYQVVNTLELNHSTFWGEQFPGKFVILGSLRCVLRLSETPKQCSN